MGVYFVEIIPKYLETYERYEPLDSQSTMKSMQNKQMHYSEITEKLR